MASIKAIAAIALTLMIAAPIGLGYLFATEDTQVTSWESESRVNLSDTILNTTTPIFMDYNDTGNNSMVIAGSPAKLTAPDYNQVSETYSSLPIFTSASGTMPWPERVEQSYTLTPGTGNTFKLELNNPNMANAHHIANSGALLLAPANNVTVTLTLQKVDGTTTTQAIYGKMIGLVQVSDESNYKVWVGGVEQPGEYHGLYITASSAVSVWTLYSSAAYNILQPTLRNFSILLSTAPGLDEPLNESTLRLVTDNEIVWINGDFTEIVRAGGNLIVDGTLYPNVSEAKMARVGYSYSALPYTYSTPEGSYADPAYGWNIGTGAEWLNGFINNYVRFMITLEDGEDCSLTPNFTDGSTGTPATLSNTSGITSVNGTTLGAYEYVMVELRPEGTTITGLQGGWPAMGAQPTRYNSITVDNTSSGRISTIDIAASSEAVEFRVDSAGILAGSFPSTLNYTLDMANLFPDKSYKLKLNSIGIYGDSITIAGETFTVTNGRISVDGSTVSLKGATISSVWNGTMYDVAINSHAIGSVAAPSSLSFNGEWSLTLTTDILKQTTNTRTDWAPGQFAFDKTDFAACGLLVAGALLVGLGMYGQRSGIKMGVLLLICGGAALIYLTFV